MKCYPTPTSLCPRGVPRASGLQLGGTGDADGLWDALPSPPAPASCLLADGGQHCADTELGVLTALLPPAGKPDGQGPHRRLRGGACLTHRTRVPAKAGTSRGARRAAGSLPSDPSSPAPSPASPLLHSPAPTWRGSEPTRGRRVPRVLASAHVLPQPLAFKVLRTGRACRGFGGKVPAHGAPSAPRLACTQWPGAGPSLLGRGCQNKALRKQSSCTGVPAGPVKGAGLGDGGLSGQGLRDLEMGPSSKPLTAEGPSRAPSASIPSARLNPAPYHVGIPGCQSLPGAGLDLGFFYRGWYRELRALTSSSLGLHGNTAATYPQTAVRQGG